MLVQFGNNWIQKVPLTAKLDSACGLVKFWLSSEFFSSNYFQIGQHVVLLHIQIAPSRAERARTCCVDFCGYNARKRRPKFAKCLIWLTAQYVYVCWSFP